MQMLAVNGKVSGYCVHLPVCNLQTVKSTEKVSRLRKSPLWEQLLTSTCLSEMPFSPSRPSHLPSLHCPHHEDDFYPLQCLILTFLAQDMLSHSQSSTTSTMSRISPTIHHSFYPRPNKFLI